MYAFLLDRDTLEGLVLLIIILLEKKIVRDMTRAAFYISLVKLDYFPLYKDMRSLPLYFIFYIVPTVGYWPRQSTQWEAAGRFFITTVSRGRYLMQMQICLRRDSVMYNIRKKNLLFSNEVYRTVKKWNIKTWS